jgi:hypothetical protein
MKGVVVVVVKRDQGPIQISVSVDHRLERQLPDV